MGFSLAICSTLLQASARSRSTWSSLGVVVEMCQTVRRPMTPPTHMATCSLNFVVHSSNSFWFMSMNSFSAL